MKNTDHEQLGRLEQKIIDLTIDDGADPDTIFTALQGAFVFWMSTVCLNCRRDVAKKLRANIPAMLNNANQVAAADKTETPTCH
jgi:hypothetical protein